jgi:tetratricopeptide (TPR) repeat protein
MNPSRRPSLNLLFIFLAVATLATLSVVSMRFYSSAFSSLNLKQIVGLLRGEKADIHIGDAQSSLKSTSLPHNVPIGQGDTQAADELTQLDGAAQKLNLQINERPRDPALHNQLGLIYEGIGSKDKAIRQFEIAVELSRAALNALNEKQKGLKKEADPDTVSVLAMIDSAKLSAELAASHSALARIYDQQGASDKVVAQLDLINKDRAFCLVRGRPSIDGLRREPSQPTMHRFSPACLQLLARAQALLQAKRAPEAIQIYKQVLVLDPQAGIAHEKLGQVALTMGNYYLAKQELVKACKLNSATANSHLLLADAYQGMTQTDLAIAELKLATTLDPKNYNALFELGSLYATGGDNLMAAQTFHKLVELNPSSPAAHNNFASSLSMTGKYHEAEEEFEKALALAPELASSHYGMGIALYNLKQYPAAISELKRALSLNPNYADAKNKIETAYRHMN